MLRTRILLLLGLCAAWFAHTPAARAAQSKYYAVERITQYTAGSAKAGLTAFYLAGLAHCDDAAGQQYFVVPDGDAKQTQIISLVTAALLSKKQITVFYSVKDGNCVVDGVQLYAP